MFFMKYKTLGKTGLKVSEISLGTEYLIDIPKEDAINVIRTALDLGINYFDLFFGQPRFRDTMGEAFRGRRKEALLAAHLGATANSEGQYERTRDLTVAKSYFEDFLTRYETDYVDVLFLHNSDGQEDFDLLMQPGGFYDLALEYKKQGKCRFIGFSSHTVETSMQAVTVPEIDLLMFPINLASHAVPGKNELFSLCQKENVGLIGMKIFGGGKLLQQDSKMEMRNEHTAGGAMVIEKPDAITATQCISYALSRTAVTCVVPGCATVEHLNDALSYYTNSEKQNDYSLRLADFKLFKKGECTYCNHCLPCPANIDIGQSIRLLDLAAAGVTPELRKSFKAMSVSPADCIRCGMCEVRCPFGVDTVDLIAESAAKYS
jgi:predicted aldo/keto reductase-like oxidoreductase